MLNLWLYLKPHSKDFSIDQTQSFSYKLLSYFVEQTFHQCMLLVYSKSKLHNDADLKWISPRTLYRVDTLSCWIQKTYNCLMHIGKPEEGKSFLTLDHNKKRPSVIIHMMENADNILYHHIKPFRTSRIKLSTFLRLLPLNITPWWLRNQFVYWLLGRFSRTGGFVR